MSVIVEGPSPIPMAAPVVSNEVYRLVQVVRFSNAVTCMNSFYFGKETTGGSSAGLVADWNTNIVPTWRNNVCQQVSFNQCYAQQVMPVQDAVAAVTQSLIGNISVAPPLPAVAAGIITWRSQGIGRSRRGRSYIAGIRWDSFTSSDYINWNANGVSYLAGIAGAILTRYTLGGNPGGYFLVVWSRKLASSPPGGDWRNAASMVTRYTVQSYVGSMGTRRGARGI
jgi:hypothetical protein